MGTVDEQIAELKKVTLEDVKKFHEQFYGADAGELIVSGDFNAGGTAEDRRGAAGKLEQPQPLPAHDDAL